MRSHTNFHKSKLCIDFYHYNNSVWLTVCCINKLRPMQNGHQFPDDIFQCIFFNENVWISIKISVKFVPKGPINNIPALVEIMAWRWPGNKPLSEQMMVRLLMHMCITRTQWVSTLRKTAFSSSFSSIRLIVIWFKFHYFFPKETNKKLHWLLLSTGVEQTLKHYTNQWFNSLTNTYATWLWLSQIDHMISSVWKISLPWTKWYFQMHFLERK